MNLLLSASGSSPASLPRLMILSSMSVKLRTYCTSYRRYRSRRYSTSNATYTRACPMWL
jgi:hypothetical protein